jgi:hypothetical protein
MSEIVAFNALFPVKATPVGGDRVLAWDSVGNVSRAISIQSILDLIADEPVTWSEITGKPSTFAPSAHSLGAHSNVSSAVDSAADGTFVKKVAGQFQAVAVDFYSPSNPAPADATIDDALRAITAARIAQWDQAHGWGNHVGQYRPISYVPGWSEITGKPSTFAPSAHSLGTHSNVASSVDSAADGTYLKKVAGQFQAVAVDFYSPSNPAPADASIPDVVRGITLGDVSLWNAKLTEFASLPDYSLPLIYQGAVMDSEIIATFSENPLEPSDPGYDPDFVPELINYRIGVPVKGVAGVEPDDFVVMAQRFSGAYADLSGIPSSFTPSAHGHAVSDLAKGAAANGQAVVWSDANNRWEPGTVASGGGGGEVAAANAGSRLYLFNNY